MGGKPTPPVPNQTPPPPQENSKTGAGIKTPSISRPPVPCPHGRHGDGVAEAGAGAPVVWTCCNPLWHRALPPETG